MMPRGLDGRLGDQRFEEVKQHCVDHFAPARRTQSRLTPGMSRALLRVGSMPLFGGYLQPATHRSLVGQVVRREAGLQVLLLSRDNHE